MKRLLRHLSLFQRTEDPKPVVSNSETRRSYISVVEQGLIPPEHILIIRQIQDKKWVRFQDFPVADLLKIRISPQLIIHDFRTDYATQKIFTRTLNNLNEAIKEKDENPTSLA